MTGKTIGPEAILALTEGHLKLDILWLMPISLEEIEGMLEDWGSALYAIIHP